jgi:hypothetical protein
VTGNFIGADIFINSIFEWSVAANGGSTVRSESVVVHDWPSTGVGAFGTGRTGRAGGGRAVLGKRAVVSIAYPRGGILDRTIEADDVAESPTSTGPRRITRVGAIAGRVTLNSSGVFGAPSSPSPQPGTSSAVSHSASQGEFVIAALPQAYIVRVEAAVAR